MFYGSQHHIENISKKGKNVLLCSRIYLQKQTFANNRRIAEIKEGDTLFSEMQNPIVSLWRQTITPDTNQLKFMDERRRTFNQSTKLKIY
jgi:hypothetical protein